MSLVASFNGIFDEGKPLLAKHETWGRVVLSDVADIVNGFPFDSNGFSTERGTPIIRIRDLANNRSTLFFDGEVPAGFCAQNGDLLIGMDGNFVCYRWTGEKVGLNQRVCKITTKENHLLSSFLFYGINGYLRAIENATSSVTVGHLSSRDVLRINFPLPPLAEQKRIVAKLDELLPRVRAARARLEKIPRLVAVFRKAILAAACDGRLTEEWRKSRKIMQEWVETISGELLNFITSGSRGWAQYYSESGPIFIRIGNLSHHTIALDLDHIQRVSPPNNTEGTRTKVQPNDILISITADVGMVALIPMDIEEAYINQHIALARPIESVSPRYLAFYFQSPTHGQLQFNEKARGATKVGLGLDDIRTINVSLPPLPEQEEIVRRVDELFALADKVEASYASAMERVNKIEESILAKAFRGELVAQDPNDEPAEELLKRILAEKAKLEGPGKGKRAKASSTERRERTEAAAEPKAKYGDVSIPRKRGRPRRG